MSARKEWEYLALQAARAVVGEYRSAAGPRPATMSEWMGKLDDALKALAALPSEREEREIKALEAAFSAYREHATKQVGELRGDYEHLSQRVRHLENGAMRWDKLTAKPATQWFRMTWPEALALIVDDRRLSARRAAWARDEAGGSITLGNLGNWVLSEEAKRAADWIVEPAVSP
jgi:hypothetical protein